MEELRCAAVISNLEGIKGLAFGVEDLAKFTTLPALEKRVRRLEDVVDITPPPPITEPSWNGLVWRIWRLRNRMPQFNLKSLGTALTFAGDDFRSMLPHADDISLTDVQNAINSIKVRALYPEFPTDFDNDDLQLSYSLQRLSHMAGKKSTYFDDVPVTLVDIYVTAVRLSLLAESDNPKVPPPPHWPRPAQPPVSIPRRTKLCCDCCNCHCHVKVVPAMPRRRGRWSRSSSRTSSPSEREVGKRKSRFGWLSSLCFWRRKRSSGYVYAGSSASSTCIVD